MRFWHDWACDDRFAISGDCRCDRVGAVRAGVAALRPWGTDAAVGSPTSPASLPSQGIQGDDVRLVKFSLAVRGYRMSDVDWTLDRLAEELDRTKIRLAELEGGSATVAIPDAAHIQTPLATDKHAAAVTVVAAAVSDDLFVNDVAPGEFAPTVELSQGSAPFEIASPTEEGPQ